MIFKHRVVPPNCLKLNEIILYFAVKPEDRPSVVGFKSRHRVGDTLSMTCYINNTFPAANLTWFVTGKRVSPQNLETLEWWQ